MTEVTLGHVKAAVVMEWISQYHQLSVCCVLSLVKHDRSCLLLQSRVQLSVFKAGYIQLGPNSTKQLLKGV